MDSKSPRDPRSKFGGSKGSPKSPRKGPPRGASADRPKWRGSDEKPRGPRTARDDKKPYTPRGPARDTRSDARPDRPKWRGSGEKPRGPRTARDDKKPYTPRGPARDTRSDARPERPKWRGSDEKPRGPRTARDDKKPYTLRGPARDTRSDARPDRPKWRGSDDRPHAPRTPPTRERPSFSARRPPAQERGDLINSREREVVAKAGSTPHGPDHAGNLRGRAALLVEEILEKRQSLKRVLQREQERIEREDDRALLREIVTGVTRHLPAIDRALASAVTRGLNETQSELLAILRVGAFQILFLDRVPLYAAVDQCVEAAKPLNPGAGGFVNGILRAVAEHKAFWSALPEGGDPASVALRTGMPIWLVRRYLERFGPAEGEAVLAALQRPAPTALVFRSESALQEAQPSLANEGWELIPDAALPLTFTVTKGNPAFSEAFRKGFFYIMDPASQAPAVLVPLRGDEAVLDLCAAPGGKTIVLSQRLTRGGWVLATDVNKRRILHLRENIERLQLPNVKVAQVDVEEGLPFGQSFSVVILDAPCSSMGTLRRNPEIRWQVREEDLALRSPKQLAFLEKASSAVAPGGTLAYSVCSMEEEETSRVVTAFLELHPDFEPLVLEPPAGWAPLLDQEAPGTFILRPDRHSWDAFFVALLRRRE